MVHKWFRRGMITINCLFAIPVVLVIFRELTGPGQAHFGKVLAAVALVGVPLCGTLAITIAGCAVLAEE